MRTSEPEGANMATWVYGCDECDGAFSLEIEEGEQVPDTAPCERCGNAAAKKMLELTQPAGGCGCGGHGDCC